MLIYFFFKNEISFLFGWISHVLAPSNLVELMAVIYRMGRKCYRSPLRVDASGKNSLGIRSGSLQMLRKCFTIRRLRSCMIWPNFTFLTLRPDADRPELTKYTTVSWSLWKDKWRSLVCDVIMKACVT